MRLHVMSDLHLDFHHDDGDAFIESLPETHSDVLVVAGDVCNGDRGRDTVRRIAHSIDALHGIYVYGNHEHYGETEPKQDAYAMTIGDVRFSCATLWFGDHDKSLRSWMSDWSQIRGIDKWWRSEGKNHLEFLQRHPADVVVTHYVPSSKLIPQQYRGHPLNCFFVRDVIELVPPPKLWIYGHTHVASDVTIGPTRFVCNPLGYPGESTGFNPGLVVELP